MIKVLLFSSWLVTAAFAQEVVLRPSPTPKKPPTSWPVVELNPSTNVVRSSDIRYLDQPATRVFAEVLYREHVLRVFVEKGGHVDVNLKDGSVKLVNCTPEEGAVAFWQMVVEFIGRQRAFQF